MRWRTTVSTPPRGALCSLVKWRGEAVLTRVDGSKRDMDALLWELEQLEFEANKTDIWSYTCQRELEEYEATSVRL
jgi:hypothetical protein